MDVLYVLSALSTQVAFTLSWYLGQMLVSAHRMDGFGHDYLSTSGLHWPPVGLQELVA